MSASVIATSPGCSDDAGNNGTKAECQDGKDNDGDGMTDFPDDLGCHAADDLDNFESDDPAPECKDGRDNDGDGKHDFPNDPGCFAPNQDDETDDCPDGALCPQCANGVDDDMNGQTDFPNDSGGCMSASDPDEYTNNPVACGGNVMIKTLPFSGHVENGMLDAVKPSALTSPMCGGAGPEDVYELRVMSPKVIVASTDNPGTTADTVLYIRSSDCINANTELACQDDVSTTVDRSTVTKAISTPGLYFLVVDAHDNASVGSYELTVKFLTGEGESCGTIDDCGPGLVCRIPKGQTAKVCAKHVCEDDVDEDNDGKNGFPDDPGCITAEDDDEADSCASGPGTGCPECADGIDNDGDQKIDFGTNGDTTCSAASSASEACISTDGVQLITAASTPGTTAMGAFNDVKPSCATSGTHTAADKTYRLDLPQMADLKVDADSMSFDGVVALYNSTCAGTAIQCKDTPETVTATNLAAGAYYFVVDGYSSGTGTYTIAVSGHIANGALCESTLTTAGAITCATGYACKGNSGSKTCQPALCSDGIDNDSPADGKIDFPFDPGCSDPADDTEADPTALPQCSDGIENDNPSDGLIDFPADFGCVGAGGTTEKFCATETDVPTLVNANTMTGQTTTGKANDWPATSCQMTSNAPDIAFALQLPVPVQSLIIDTIGSYDTVLQWRDAQCGTMLACDDDSGGALTSKMTLSNVSPGGYSIIVDGYNSANGAVTLHVNGTVTTGTKCGFSLFQGANPVLKCPTGTTCTGSPAKCQ